MLVIVFFVAQQGFAVSNGDLVIVWVDFAKGQEAMAIAAIVDKGGLQGRLNARHLGEVDVTPQLLALGRFKVEFLDAVTCGNDDPCFFRVDGIHQHSLGSHN